MIGARVVLAMSLAVFAASFPPLRVAILGWIVPADRVPETVWTDAAAGMGQPAPVSPVG
jgi:hypothetical protein